MKIVAKPFRKPVSHKSWAFLSQFYRFPRWITWTCFKVKHSAAKIHRNNGTSMLCVLLVLLNLLDRKSLVLGSCWESSSRSLFYLNLVSGRCQTAPSLHASQMNDTDKKKAQNANLRSVWVIRRELQMLQTRSLFSRHSNAGADRSRCSVVSVISDYLLISSKTTTTKA